MPHSLVFNFTNHTPIPTPHLKGRCLHALFLTLVSSVDQQLGNRLHEQQRSKAFTLSPLQIHRQQNSSLQWDYKHSIKPHTSCWWRVSLLDESLFSHLSSLWLNLSPQQLWRLGPAELQITSIVGTPSPSQPWAHFISYPHLFEAASEENRQIRIRFCTPTAFRQGSYDSPLPTRDCVFKSLLDRWNSYSPLPFTEEILPPLFPSRFNLRTEILKDNSSSFIGCVGEIAFRILGNDDPLVIKQINALADFSLFSGIGRKTPMGMGMVRRVPT